MRASADRILVLGGTGLLGRPTVLEMLAAGLHVRLFARDPQKTRLCFDDRAEIVGGDAADRRSLERAAIGCRGIHVSVGGSLDRTSAENAAAIGRSLGLERISYVSGSTVDERNRWFPMVAQKLDAEQAIRESGVPYTIFRPTWPMEQLPRFIRDGHAIVIGDALPPLHWFAARDLGRLVARAYETEMAANRCFYVHGPEAWTMPEALGQYRASMCPEIEAVTVIPVAAARAEAARSGDPMLGFMADTMAYFDQAGELGSAEETEGILGPIQTTLAAWLALQPPRVAQEVPAHG
jgi:uncharacterized protein YbjT (DUF2867 family)